jgi:sodium/potassium-transporting ATPase subunit alpha
MQVVNVFLCRSSVRSVFSRSFSGNSLILWGVVLQIALMLMAIYGSWGNYLLGTAIVPAKVWLLVIPFALVMLGLEEIRKWIVRRSFVDKLDHPAN